MAKVAAYLLAGNGHANITVPTMVEGAKLCGDVVTIMPDTAYRSEHVAEYDTAIFWGYVETLQAAMAGYRAAGKSAVYLDLAYWARDTHYKVSVNARHPTEYFQRIQHPSDRRKALGVEAQPYRFGGEHILLAGMGAKATWAEKEGLPETWERAAITEIRKYTKRPIVYRPKPSWAAAKPIEGTVYSAPKTPLGSVLKTAHAVVARHSNVCVDGLVLGVPAFCTHGVATPMALQELAAIEHPRYPLHRELWMDNIAYCQWSLSEMRDGTCWRHLKSEGLIK